MGSINKINFDSTTPLGFTRVPELEIFSKTGSNGKVEASLGVYSGWWYYNGMFRGTREDCKWMTKSSIEF